ncbi:2-oxo-4-hydroxy-4-carboxy-5-ureidoimidazoline decarboxylase [Acrasis kona]|uniref:2-oxo-4-hydroxy-4-carboxy-5-ureidoimidazoline decarboxylase n=1 Tax=Acrasis kona TaxID=1008807 RepID=A0AAW2ZTJ2_9EUKA
MQSKTLDELNNLTKQEFLSFVEPAFERTPDVSIYAYDQTIGSGTKITSADHLSSVMWTFIDNYMSEQEKHKMVSSHPELQSKKRREQESSGQLSADSMVEHKKAGLDVSSLTKDQLDRFDNYNEQYRERFGFPFIVCVRYVPDKALGLLEAFEKRINNSKEQEFEMAVEELKKIGQARIRDRITE